MGISGLTEHQHALYKYYSCSLILHSNDMIFIVQVLREMFFFFHNESGTQLPERETDERNAFYI